MKEAAQKQGATDRELNDTVPMAARFSLYNRQVDGMGGILLQKGSLPSEDR